MVTTVRKVLLIAASSLLIMSGASAQQPSGEGVLPSADASAEPEQLVKIATLNTPQANDEFTRNVQIMQEQRRAVANLYALLAQEEDEDIKYNIEAKIHELMVKLNDENKRMAEAFHYTLNRRYVRSIENATVYIQLSDEEADSHRKKLSLKGETPPKSLKSNMLSVCTLNTAEAAQAFQKDVASMQAKRDIALEMQMVVENAETPDDKAYAQGRLDQVLGQVSAFNKEMVRAYGFSISRNYVLQIDKSSLFVWALASEIADASSSN